MRYLKLWALLAILALATAGVAAAQSAPEPVVRLGNWIEIGDDTWMNIIGTNTMRYRWTDNVNFDDKVQDITAADDLTSGNCLESSCDMFQIETRLGADFRYRKNLTMRVLFEQQNVFDGTEIDGNRNEIEPHVERAWIDYKVPNTSLRMRVGAHLWEHDPLRWVRDDDPGIHFWYTLGPDDAMELYASAIIENDSTGLGLTNDNDHIYYMFTAAYKLKPHRFSLNVIYSRDRYCPNCERNRDEFRQKTDAIYITPAWEGRFGILKFIAQGSLVFGEVKRGPAPGENLDIFAGAAQIAVEAKLGRITPFFTVLYGSGDDDPFDDELNGYNTLASKEVSGQSGVSILNTLVNSTMFSGIEQGPTYAHVFGAGSGSRIRSGDNIFNNNMGFHQSYDVRGLYANPGTLVPAIGVKFALAKAWRVDAHWAGKWVMETETIEEQLNRENNRSDGRTADIDKFIYQEFGAMVTWRPSKHFDIRARGIIALPGDGAEDIAAMANPENCGRAAATETCDGDDPMLVGQLMFRGRF